MIEIFGENCSQPLDFYAKKKEDKNPILPIQSPPHQSDNFENRRTAAMRESTCTSNVRCKMLSLVL